LNGVRIYVDGIGLFGPGLSGWAHASEVLSGQRELELAPLRLPPAEALPSAERRRAGLAVKLSMATGFEAVRHAGVNPAQLATVFASSGGDCDNCHQILETLASADRAVSPTRFHNSVHNAPSGYWSIATACMAPSTSLCAYNATFVAGIIEAATQALVSGKPCMLLAFDTAYPEPLHALRPIPFAFGVAMVLNPHETAAATASLTLMFSQTAATTMADGQLESLRTRVPAARSLPMLQHIARGSSAKVVLDYLDAVNLDVTVQRES
jgi:hypothetical protein